MFRKLGKLIFVHILLCICSDVATAMVVLKRKGERMELRSERKASDPPERPVLDDYTEVGCFNWLLHCDGRAQRPDDN
jgi:hypothetical protein